MASRKTSTAPQTDLNPNEQPEIVEAEEASTTSTTEDAAIAESAFVRNLVDDDLEGEQEPEVDEEGNPKPETPKPALMTKEEFRAWFISAHDYPSIVDPDLHVFSIPEKSGHLLHDGRYDGACAVADRLYDRCAAKNAPNWLRSLIHADLSGWTEWMALGAYGFGFVIAARQLKQIKIARASEAQEVANNDAAPEFTSTREADAA